MKQFHSSQIENNYFHIHIYPDNVEEEEEEGKNNFTLKISVLGRDFR
jgi:hypothetical protein